MRRIVIFLFILFLISCPPQKPIEPEKIPEVILIKKAKEIYQENPLFAYNLLKNIRDNKYQKEKIKILFSIYFEQREFKRAEELLDSLSFDETDSNYAPLEKKINLILINNKSWEKLFKYTHDTFIKGISAYRLSQYEEALDHFKNSNNELIVDYRLLYIAKVLNKMGKNDEALNMLLRMDSISSYLLPEYQDLIFNLLLSTNDAKIIKKERYRIKSKPLNDYLELKVYEMEKDFMRLHKKAWELIKKSPDSFATRYALSLVKPKTKKEYKLFGRAYYLLGDYDNALKYLKKSMPDGEVACYIGRIYYNRGETSSALNYLINSKCSAGYYYRARIYEDQGNYKRAIKTYDSLIILHKNSEYAKNALKRKAFLYEDTGDTLGAIKAFLSIKEKLTDFRAGIELFKRGNLREAIEIFKRYDSPEFLYWQIKAKERLGEGVDSLKNYLLKNHPFSYYTLIKNNISLALDTTPVIAWLTHFGDTTTSFDRDDSLHLKKALRYFELGEIPYALREIEMIEGNSLLDLFYLSSICMENGADWASIKFCLQIKNRIEKKTQIYSRDFLKRLYPVRYLFTIMDGFSGIYLFLAMIWQESLFNPNAISRSNAQGLVQIIPLTGKTIGYEIGITDYSLFDPEIAIKFGSHYLNKMLDDFKNLPPALAAYNAGPARVKKWINKNPNYEMDEFIELIPYAETRDYVRDILSRKKIYETLWQEIIPSSF